MTFDQQRSETRLIMPPLVLVQALSDRWGTRPPDGGKAMWADSERSAAEPQPTARTTPSAQRAVRLLDRVFDLVGGLRPGLVVLVPAATLLPVVIRMLLGGGRLSE